MGWARWLLLGDLGQQLDINEVRDHVERMRTERDLANWDLHKIREVADELLELELRHGLLVRLRTRNGALLSRAGVARHRHDANAARRHPAPLGTDARAATRRDPAREHRRRDRGSGAD